MWLYKFIDVPQLPPELEAKVLNLYRDLNRESHRIPASSYAAMKSEEAGGLHPKDVVVTKNGKSYRNSLRFRYTLDQQVSDWIHKNLSNQYIDCGLSVTFGPSGLLAPHTDALRHFAVLYTFETGGADVRTIFYQEDNYPIERPLRVFGHNYSKLNEVHTVQFPSRTWIIMNAHVLHSVENLVSDRVQIQLSLNSVPNEWLYTKEVTL